MSYFWKIGFDRSPGPDAVCRSLQAIRIPEWIFVAVDPDGIKMETIIEMN